MPIEFDCKISEKLRIFRACCVHRGIINIGEKKIKGQSSNQTIESETENNYSMYCAVRKCVIVDRNTQNDDDHGIP